MAVEVNGCAGCAHKRDEVIFELCAHASSQYNIAGKLDLHTTNHMRKNACGHDGRLFKPQPTILGGCG